MAFIKGFLSITFIVINTIVCCVPIYLLAVPRFILPHGEARAALGNAMTRIIDLWVGNNRLMIRVLRITRIEVEWDTAKPLARDQWTLVMSNHQGWSDILILQDTFLNRIPPLKFFVKRQLLWGVPFLGVAMWLLDFPYVYRFSRAAIQANPSLRQKDADAVLEACKNFKWRPTSVLNFLEGTRLTPEKHAAQQSPFRHLLTPKTGGVTAVLSSLGDRIDHVLDVTITYPDGIPTFLEFLRGDVARVKVHIRSCSPPKIDDVNGATVTRAWVDDVWRAKDARIEQTLSAR